MGSVALACSELGHNVTGSDSNVYPPMSTVLSGSGIVWYEGYSSARLESLPIDLFVVGNALSRGNPELEYVLRNRLSMTSMAALVGQVLIDKNTSIVVSGTHGKTTTTSMTAWILESAGFQPGFMMGGVPLNFPVGCRALQKDVNNSRAGVFVSEGDEYDTAFFDKRSKFVHYRPTVAIVNNIEFDHADIFNDLGAIVTSFKHMLRLVPDNGIVLINSDDANVAAASTNSFAPIQSVGLAEDAFWRASNLLQSSREMSFDLDRDGLHYGNFTINMPGEHSVRNAVMAIAATHFVGVNAQEQQTAFKSFIAPKRRLEAIGTWNGALVIDDFAHHPTAIAATVKAVRNMYPNNKIHAVFEPRSNTTTRNFFQKELSECFDGADTVCVGPINRPERYAVEDRLDTKAIISALISSGINATQIDSSFAETPWGAHVEEFLSGKVQATDIILLLSNGNIGGFRDAVTSIGK